MGHIFLTSKRVKIKDKRQMRNLLLQLIFATFTLLNSFEVIVQHTAFKSLICFMDVLLAVK